MTREVTRPETRKPKFLYPLCGCGCSPNFEGGSPPRGFAPGGLFLFALLAAFFRPDNLHPSEDRIGSVGSPVSDPAGRDQPPRPMRGLEVVGREGDEQESGLI